MAISDEFDLDIPSSIDLLLAGTFNVRSSVRLGASRLQQISAALRSTSTANEFRDILDTVLREAISANEWRTRNGIDDIIDTGELRNSSNISITGSSGRSKISISYDVPYAALVHYGGYIVPWGNSRAKRIYLPPRPWVADVLGGHFSGFNPSDVYRQIILRTIQAAR